MRATGIAVLVSIVLANLGVWWWMNRPHADVPWNGVIQGISFSPNQKDDNPIEGRHPTLDDIDRDLQMLEGKVTTVRTYSTMDGMEYVPELAEKYGISVMVGAWLDESLGRNEAEIRNLISMARNSRNVKQVLVGNESLYRDDVTVQQLIRYLRRVREKVKVPVSTAEPWHVWLQYPELAREVDYVAAHILPYWEGIPIEHAMDFLLDRYYELQRAFPNKRIVITEVGWPSAGKARRLAEPSLVNEAAFLRRFLNVAEERGIEYNVIEAFDQPWKKQLEWSVGAHWGIWDADRNQKFSFTAPVVEISAWPLQAGAATLIALLPLAWFVSRWQHLRARGKLFFGVMVQAAASLAVWMTTVPIIKDFAPEFGLMFGLLVPGQLLLFTVVLIAGLEMTELTWAGRMRRRFLPFTPESIRRFPKVSIHLAICNEPPQMVKLTLDSLNRLDYPNLEVLIIDNNTKDPAVWQPVKEYCEQLGEKFRFFTLGKWPGFKAGALNFALSQTAPDAEIVGVVDSDYVVDKDWLRSLVPYFDNPRVGWVQAPQDHREWENDPFKEMINWEYAGFFHIGMVARNEDDAIIQHGTMTLIRKEALANVGNWGEWCICEDAETGLRMLQAGYESVYVNRSFGHGLTPDTFLGYKKQRFRWAFGAMQIMKHHWRALMPFNHSGLTLAQKYHFLAGWLPWLADAFYLLFVMFSLVWSVGLVVAPRFFDFPLEMFVVPTIGVFIAKVAHHLFLYGTRVDCTWRQRIGSAIAGMALTYSIALAVWQGFFKKSTPFIRTPKCENKAAFTKGFLMAGEESLLMLAQWTAAVAVLTMSQPYNPTDAKLWAVVLFIQSVPFAAALTTSMISALPSRRARTRTQMLSSKV
ncbi:MAG: glycosyltransferase [Rhodospirillales bacterium]|nr:glycosyltransferase [Rhodospirillales bacterium]